MGWELLAKKYILIVLILFFTTLLSQLSFPKYDFIQYWSSAQLLDKGINPYIEENIGAIEITVRDFGGVIRMWNPPFIFLLIYPLKFFSNYNLIESLWVLLSIITYIVCAFLLIRKYIGEKCLNYFLLLCMIIFVFPPLWAMLHMAQIGFVLLFAATSYLLLRDQKKYFLAGFLLSISLIKPHSFYLLYLFSFASDIKCKNFKAIFGFTTGLFCLFGSSLIIEPNGWSWYFEAMASPPVYFKTTTLGSFLMDIFGFEYKFLRFLPMLICIPLCLFVLTKNLNEQVVRAITIAIIPLSQLTTPYGWPADQLAMLPAIIYLLSFVISDESLNTAKIKIRLTFFILLNLLGYVCVSTRSYDELVWYTALISFVSFAPIRKSYTHCKMSAILLA